MSDSNTHDELNTQIQYRLIEKLSESERRYRELVENLNEIVFKADCRGCLTFLNPAWTRVLGYPVTTALGQPLDRFIDGSDRAVWQAILTDLEARSPLRQELQFRHSGGQTVWLEIAIQSRGISSEFSGSLIDVTDRRQAEQLLHRINTELESRVAQRTKALDAANQELRATIKYLQQTQYQLVQAEKMSGLVQFVAGLAHEINNPVNFIHGNLDCLEDYIQSLMEILNLYQLQYPNATGLLQEAIESVDLAFLKDDAQKVIASIKTGTHRIRQIVSDLRNLSRMDESELKTVSLHENIDSVLKILNYRLKTRLKPISITKDYGTLPLVQCYPKYLNQAIMSILENAIDAIDDVPQKSIQQIVFDQVPQRIGKVSIKTLVLEEQWICIEIADNGVGIPVAIQNQIFNPFFTTKLGGKAIGMGLAISDQMITEKHHGKLSFQSQEHGGTTFTIQIPIHQPEQPVDKADHRSRVYY